MDRPALCLEGTGFDADGVPLWHQLLHYNSACFEIRHSAENAASFPRLRFSIRPDFIPNTKTNESKGEHSCP